MDRSISGVVITISTAIYLFAAGILCFLTKWNILRGPIYEGVKSLFGKGDFTNVLAIILAVIAIAGGVFILLRMLGMKIPAMNLCLIILAILWAFILVLNIINAFKTKDYGFWKFMLELATNGLILGGILASTEQFGGK